MNSFSSYANYRRFALSVSPASEFKPREIRVLRVKGWSTTEAQERIWQRVSKVRNLRVYNLRRYPTLDPAKEKKLKKGG